MEVESTNDHLSGATPWTRDKIVRAATINPTFSVSPLPSFQTRPHSPIVCKTAMQGNCNSPRTSRFEEPVSCSRTYPDPPGELAARWLVLIQITCYAVRLWVRFRLRVAPVSWQPIARIAVGSGLATRSDSPRTLIAVNPA
jgi:hypothetical protein